MKSQKLLVIATIVCLLVGASSAAMARNDCSDGFLVGGTRLHGHPRTIGTDSWSSAIGLVSATFFQSLNLLLVCPGKGITEKALEIVPRVGRVNRPPGARSTATMQKDRPVAGAVPASWSERC